MIGAVLRLQVQRSRLKPGPASTRVYDPAPLLPVPELEVGPRGVVGWSGADCFLDVHHADCPGSRNSRLRNGISLLTVGHYQALRTRYGPHVVDGVAGESLLVDAEQVQDLSGRLVLDTRDGPIAFTSAPAAPCVEFSRFLLRRPAGDVGPQVRTALRELGKGARGYYLQTSGTGRVRVGDRLRFAAAAPSGPA